jgi:hypothetical protein
MKKTTQTAKKASHISAFVVGAKPPQVLSSKAQRQLSRTKPSKRALELAASAARAISNNFVMIKTVTEGIDTPATSKKPRLSKIAVTTSIKKGSKRQVIMPFVVS